MCKGPLWVQVIRDIESVVISLHLHDAVAPWPKLVQSQLLCVETSFPGDRARVSYQQTRGGVTSIALFPTVRTLAERVIRVDGERLKARRSDGEERLRRTCSPRECHVDSDGQKNQEHQSKPHGCGSPFTPRAVPDCKEEERAMLILAFNRLLSLAGQGVGISKEPSPLLTLYSLCCPSRPLVRTIPSDQLEQ